MAGGRCVRLCSTHVMGFWTVVELVRVTYIIMQTLINAREIRQEFNCCILLRSIFSTCLLRQCGSNTNSPPRNLTLWCSQVEEGRNAIVERFG